ncbi:hypothetical protein Q8F55_008187 [Vanrija albida]|uniref:Uncharacterized protein n=1 Tax=Vanrija albida TaxID=181172 RepID=A0ABR3PVI9_9TREE
MRLLSLALVAASASASAWAPREGSEAMRRAMWLGHSHNPLLFPRRIAPREAECVVGSSTVCASGNGCAGSGDICCQDNDVLRCKKGEYCRPAGCCTTPDGCNITDPLNITTPYFVPSPPETTAAIVGIDPSVNETDVNLDTQVQYTGEWSINSSRCHPSGQGRKVSTNGSALIVFDESVYGVAVYLGADPWAKMDINVSNTGLALSNIGTDAVFIDGCKGPQQRWKFWVFPGVRNYAVVKWEPPPIGARNVNPNMYLQRIVVFSSIAAVNASVLPLGVKNDTNTTGPPSSPNDINTDIFGPKTGSKTSPGATGSASASAGASGTPNSGDRRSFAVSAGSGVLAIAVAAFVLL